MVIKQILKFIGCAILATTTDLVVYYTLINFFPISISKGLSYIMCACVAYMTNKRFTFKQKNTEPTQIKKFARLYTSTFFVNVGSNKIAFLILPKATLICFMFAAFITMVSNFLGQKYYVFRTSAT